MPDPIASSSSNLTCNLDDDPSLTPQPESAPSARACYAPVPAFEPANSGACSALVQKFQRAEPPALVAPPPPPSSGTAPAQLLTVRPDQLDLQTGIPRIQAHATLGSAQLTGSIDILTANAHLGSLNADGSRGENIGAGATLLGGELNIDYHGWSLTIGVAASPGISISSGGGRDLDGDGIQERCFAMSLGPFTLGECDEL